MLQTVELLSRTLPSLKPRRGPRAEEIALMQMLVAGPRAVTEGPIGRCVKRGWCRALVIDAPKPTGTSAGIVFALTDAGRALLAEVE